LDLYESEIILDDADIQADLDAEIGILAEMDVEKRLPKYKEGNKVFGFFLPGNKTAIISKVYDAVNETGYPIYQIVDEEGVIHDVCETLFDDEETLIAMGILPNQAGIVAEKDSDYIEKIRQENEEAIEQIINSLGLKSSEDSIEQLKNCCRLQAYMAENNSYNSNVMAEKGNYSDEFITDIDLHNALVEKSGVCTSNSLMFQSILSKLGIPVECIGLTVDSGGFHMANIVLLHGEWYYFDTTLEGEIRRDNQAQELVLCCAGLGSQEYCPYFNPQCIVRKDETLELPQNISVERIPISVVNSFLEQSSYSEKSK